MRKDRAIQVLEDVRVMYDSIASEFDRTRQRVWPLFEDFTPYLPAEARILDVGCGNGRLLKFLEGKSWKSYKGIDPSRKLLDLARQQHKEAKVSFREGSIVALPVKAGSYDAVFSIAVLHHVGSRDLQIQALTELERSLDRNGHLFLTVWNMHQWKYAGYFVPSFFRWLFTLGRYSMKDLWVPWGKREKRYVYAFGMPELRKRLKEAGFEVMESRTVGTGQSGNHVIVASPFRPSSIRPGARILGVDFDAVTLKEAMDFVEVMLKSGRQHTVATPNPEILLMADKDSEYREILNKASLKIADGAGVLWASLVVESRGVRRVFRGLFELFGVMMMPWRSRRVFPERVTGTDLMQKLLDQSAVMGAKVFLLGAAPGVAEQVAQKWRVASIVGTYAGSPAPEHAAEIIKRVNASGANMLFVAYGAPAQEQWIARHLKKMPNVRVAMGVGGAFDFVAGVRSRAPEWVGKLGLEWLWRLAQQPRRVSRIFNATVRFPWRVMQGKNS